MPSPIPIVVRVCRAALLLWQERLITTKFRSNSGIGYLVRFKSEAKVGQEDGQSGRAAKSPAMLQNGSLSPVDVLVNCETMLSRSRKKEEGKSACKGKNKGKVASMVGRYEAVC